MDDSDEVEHGLQEDLDNEGLYYHDHPFGSPFHSLLTATQVKVFQMLEIGGSCVRYDGVCYLFVPSVGFWFHCRSSIASRHLAELLDMSNVSVNFGIAVEPYVAVLESHAPSCSSIPMSVCIGTFRLSVSMYEDKLLYSPVNYVTIPKDRMVVTSLGSYRRSGLCFKSISCSRIPRWIRLKTLSLAEEVLSNVLNEDYLTILLWCIGNVLLDPVSGSKIIVLSGRGGNGKTEVINIVQANMIGITAALTQDYLGNDKVKMKEEDIQLMLNNRVITFGDCELADGYKFNSSFLKVLTSNDKLTSKSISGKVQCLGLFGTNDLYFPTKALVQPWFSRRVVTFNLPPITKDLPPLPDVYNDVDILYFVNSALRVRMQNPSLPVPINVALDTIFGSKAQAYTRGIRLCEDASEIECSIACDLMATIAKLDIEFLIELIYKVNPSLVCQGRHVRYVKGLSVARIVY